MKKRSNVRRIVFKGRSANSLVACLLVEQHGKKAVEMVGTPLREVVLKELRKKKADAVE